MRRAELCGLRWSDIDYSRPTKRYKPEERLKAGALWASAAEVFLTSFGEPIYPDTATSTFSDAVQKIDLTPEQIGDPPSFHSLRRLHCALLLTGGIPVHVVSERLGHSSASATWRVYSHMLPGDGESAVEAFEKALTS